MRNNPDEIIDTLMGEVDKLQKKLRKKRQREMPNPVKGLELSLFPMKNQH